MNAKGRILVVDDEPDFLEFVEWQLERLEYSVRTADSGEAALAILGQEAIDVMLADIRMPGMDGIELIRRAMEINGDLQSIVITGHGGIETAVDAMRLGAINYLRKPVGVNELDVAIQKGMEKLAMIRQLRAKQESLEQANEELTRLRARLEQSLEKEIGERKNIEEELKKSRLREALVEVLSLSLRYWKETTKKSKIELAEESRIWTASIDSGGTYRTRTLDRYMKTSTLPANPRTNDVLDTAWFVLSNCPPSPEMKDMLEEKISGLEKLLRSDEM